MYWDGTHMIRMRSKNASLFEIDPELASNIWCANHVTTSQVSLSADRHGDLSQPGVVCAERPRHDTSLGSLRRQLQRLAGRRDGLPLLLW